MDIKPLDIPRSSRLNLPVIAGPCSAESGDQVLATAQALSQAGIKIFRAGVWKPRTKPGGFEGVGAEGLDWLKEVKASTGMLVATEVATAAHVEAALSAGVDILWLGARTTVNPFAVQEVADSLRGEDITVLVKNPVNADLELWIGAIERLYNAGIRNIGAVHRGFTTYGEQFYRNAPQWNIPFELKRRLPSMTLICDPSHIGGRRELLAPISQQAIDMGFNGLIVESHINPESALSDAAQQITPVALGEMLQALVVRHAKSPTETLTLLRQQIDNIDTELLDVLNRRMAVSRQIGEYKQEHQMSVLQADRYSDILASRIEAARQMGMSPEFTKAILETIHQESVNQQLKMLKK